MLEIVAKKWLEFETFGYLRSNIPKKRRREIPSEGVTRFLCIRMNTIGDTIMTQPAWSTLKSALPDAYIDPPPSGREFVIICVGRVIAEKGMHHLI